MMRLIGLLVMVMSIGIARQRTVLDYSGVWIADRARSDLGLLRVPSLLVRSVSQDGTQLTVVEMSGSESGKSVTSRQCVLMTERRGAVKDGGACRRTSVLGCPTHRELWTISQDGSELTVRPLVENARSSEDRMLVFRRSRSVE